MARPKTLPPGSFDLRPDAAVIEQRIKTMVDEGHNGKQVQDELGISKSQFQKLMARNGWKVERNVGRSRANGNVIMGKRIKMTCPTCSKENEWAPWQVKGKTSKFCNNVCAGNERS